jgi:hypothetical protein
MGKPQRFEHVDTNSPANENPHPGVTSRAEDEENLAQVAASTKPTIKTVAWPQWEPPIAAAHRGQAGPRCRHRGELEHSSRWRELTTLWQRRASGRRRR